MASTENTYQPSVTNISAQRNNGFFQPKPSINQSNENVFFKPAPSANQVQLAPKLPDTKQPANCDASAVKTQTYASVANEFDFAAMDGYTPIVGPMFEILSDGDKRFFCYHDKKVFVKYNKDGKELVPDIEAEYAVKTGHEKGQPWTGKELFKLSQALHMLGPREIALLNGYKLIRRKGVGFLVEPDQIGAANTTHDVVANDYEIEFWDSCFDGSSETDIKPIPGTLPGVACIVHEFGHVMEFGRIKPLNVAIYNQDKFYKMYNDPSTKKTEEMKTKMKELMAITHREEALNNKKPTVESEFEKLTKGKPPLTEYSKTNEEEAFAEAYAIFKLNPDLLKNKNLKLYLYFAKGGYF